MAEYQEEHVGKSGGGFNWKWLIYGAVGLYVLSQIFFGGGEEDYYEEKFTEPTGGLITHIEEVQEEEFKITDEETIPERADSKIVATFLTGEIDTFTLEEATLTSSTDTRTRGMRGVVYGGLMGYMMGKNMSTPTSASSYKNAATHSRVQGKAGKAMAATASTRTVKKPVSSKKGYGSGKSSRSYGG